jgi:starch synthase
MRMKVLLASSEVHPYSKTGGLGDMVGAMAKALAEQGAEVDVVTPLYRGIREAFGDLELLDGRMKLPLGAELIQGRVWRRPWRQGLRVYFIDQPHFYDRAALYQEGGRDYADNAERFVFFAKAVAHLARATVLGPDIVHAHDWQAALAPLLLEHQRRQEGWSAAPRTCMTIHNLAYQGLFPSDRYGLTNLPGSYFHPGSVEFYGAMNCLKAGIVHSERLTTVSPRYAREILTEAYGCGLDGVLRERQHVLSGILNGVDYSEWRTTGNPHLRHPYTVRDLAGKTREKVDLQRELGLTVSDRIPLFGNISRLVDQKGTDLLLAALEEMLTTPMQAVLLGSGAPEFEAAYRQILRRHPGKVYTRVGYDTTLAHRIEAASDFYLMPSRFEPCGLNQMYSLRYGAVPVARATGGLDDSIVDPIESLEHANGIKFFEASSRALAKAIRKALVLFQEPDLLGLFRRNAMTSDFSWERTARQYLYLYEQLCRIAP